MKTKHTFVSLLDLPEILPVAITKDTNTERADTALFRFIDELSRSFREKIYYIGQDNIGEKFYERFLFEKNGFLEVMTQKPVAIVAHFLEKKRAHKFANTLKSTISRIKNPVAKMVADSIEVSTEKEEVLGYKTWSKLKQIRDEV